MITPKSVKSSMEEINITSPAGSSKDAGASGDNVEFL